MATNEFEVLGRASRAKAYEMGFHGRPGDELLYISERMGLPAYENWLRSVIGGGQQQQQQQPSAQQQAIATAQATPATPTQAAPQAPAAPTGTVSPTDPTGGTAKTTTTAATRGPQISKAQTYQEATRESMVGSQGAGMQGQGNVIQESLTNLLRQLFSQNLNNPEYLQGLSGNRQQVGIRPQQFNLQSLGDLSWDPNFWLGTQF